jgi:predicted Zn finger-like uncharacterized protein
MTGEIRCPSCSSALRVSGALLGREVKCPRCATVFTAEEDRSSEAPVVPRARQEDSPAPTTAVRREQEREERDLPRLEHPEPEEDEDYDRWDVRRRGARAAALSRVQGPGTLLQVYGVFWVLAAGGLVVLVGYGLTQLGSQVPASREDAIVMTALGSIGTVFSALFGVLICWGGTRMKALRSYGLAMAATILTFVVAFFACALLVVVGIWPLIVLSDSAVREQFE